MVKVTVIIPSLNVALYINECVQSVMHQTLKDIEILCIDAGSTDGTREQLAALAQTDSRIRIIESEIRSYGYQVNLGLEQARGQYIGIVESDDYIDEDMFAHLYQLAERFSADVAKADTYLLRKNGDKRIRHTLSGKLSDFYLRRVANTDLLQLHVIDENLWNGLYKRSAIFEKGIRLNTSRGAAYQDIGFQQQIHMLASSFVYSSKPVYYYRMDREGSSTNMPGWLQYVLQESQFLEHICPQHSHEWMVHRKAIHARLANCFSVELERTLASNNFLWDSADWLGSYHLLKKMIIGWMDASDIDMTLLTARQQANVKAALESLESYSDLIKARIQINASKRDLVLNTVSDHQCIVFGAGRWGHSVAEMLTAYHKRIIAYSDNNQALWHTSIDDIEVLPPCEAVRMASDVVFVVANKEHGNEIIQQLRQLDIPPERIVSYTVV